MYMQIFVYLKYKDKQFVGCFLCLFIQYICVKSGVYVFFWVFGREGVVFVKYYVEYIERNEVVIIMGIVFQVDN